MNSALVCLTTFGFSLLYCLLLYMDSCNKGAFSMRKQINVDWMFSNFFVMLVCQSFKGALQVSQLGLSLESYESGETAELLSFSPFYPLLYADGRLNEQWAVKFTTQQRGSDWMAFKCGRQQGKQEVAPPPPRSPGITFFFWTVSFHVMVNNQGLTAAHDLERGRPQP